MKIVVLIGTPAHLNYLANKIASEHEIALVIKENARKNLLKKIWNTGLLKSLKITTGHFLSKRKLKRIHNEVFGDKWKDLNSNIPFFETDNINNPSVVQQINGVNPDLIIVQGTTLIKSKTLKGVPLVLNLHWGLSPYYKGSMCTEWAILRKDIHNIGFTIHKIDAKIDGGDIFTQGRPQITKDDTSYSINMKLTKEGAAAMTATIHMIKEEKALSFVTQDKDIGHLFLMKHWTNKENMLLREAEKELSYLIHHSSPRQYPIVKNGFPI